VTLSPGSKLGPYEIVAPLGAGGMGEVYRARDTRLARDVAIKALPEAFARDPERLARFEREAKLLASLNHPNVAGIYGLEVAEDHRYLVLELVEGESLAERLSRGLLPVDEAIDVCRQVAAGVEAAHEAGVVHRDLKPGNVMLRPDGTVKVLDFGLAKGGAAGGTASSDPSLAASPTVTYATTTAGMILGTAAYMSPEQARGRAVDKRSDVWSFGCVLYECLTAHQAFHGETVSDLIASILKTEVDLRALPAAAPLRLRELLARCLCKEPRDRLRDIGEARVALASIRVGEDALLTAATAPGGRRVPLWAAVSAAFALVALAVVMTLQAGAKRAPAAMRTLDLVADGIEMDWFFTPQLSPDGRWIAYVARNRVWLRDLELLDARAVADVEGITSLCWSQDSGTLVFGSRKKLWRVPTDTSTPMLICDVPGTGDVIGATCSHAGVVAFSVWRGGIYQVPLTGGAPKVLFANDPAAVIDFHDPFWLSNGDLLYVVHWKDRADSTGQRRPILAVFDGTKQLIVPGGFSVGSGMPRVTATGKLLYVRHDANPGIWVVSYDVERRRVSGEPRLVAAGAASISVSQRGSLLYMEGGDQEDFHQMVWTDRSGKVVEEIGTPHPGLWDPTLSPDGQRVAFSATKGGNEDIWVRDLVRGIDTRITFAEARETFPQWINSSRLTYVELAENQSRILAVNADGSGGQSVVAPALGTWRQDAHFAPGGESAVRVVYEDGHKRLRIATVLPDGTLGPPSPLLRFQPEPEIDNARVSPDGRLLAYATDDPGQPDIFVTRYPSGEGHWQVSNEGGRQPRWAKGSRELFLIAGSGPSRRSMVAVAIDASQDPPVGTMTRLFEIEPAWLRQGEMPYDISADGTRFLMVRENSGTVGRPKRMVLVQNWETGLAKQAER